MPQAPVSPADLGLTERQMDVLTLIMQGKSNKAIWIRPHCRVPQVVRLD
jgi:DNA-binding CsgD family transcriptional regulator